MGCAIPTLRGRGRSWTAAYGLLLLILGVSCALHFRALAMAKTLPTLMHLPVNLETGFDSILHFRDLEKSMTEVRSAAIAGLASCWLPLEAPELQEAAESCREGSTPNGTTDFHTYSADYSSEHSWSLGALRKVGLDPVLGVGALRTMGERLDDIYRNSTVVLTGLADDETASVPCSSAAPLLCGAAVAAGEVLSSQGDVDREVDLLLSSKELEWLELVLRSHTLVLWTVPFVLIILTLVVWWHAETWAFCVESGGRTRRRVTVGVHSFMVLVCLHLLSFLCLLGIEMKLDVGAFTFSSLRGDPTIVELVSHLQGEFPELWDFIMGSHDAAAVEKELDSILLSSGCLLACCLGIMFFTVALISRRPFAEKGCTAEELIRDIQGDGWPEVPESELRELRALRPCQLQAIAHVRRRCKRQHLEALPKLRRRVSCLGFRSVDLDRALAWVREMAPIIIHVKLEKCGLQLAEDTHYRNQFQIHTSGGMLDNQKRKYWEDDLFGGAYRNASPFERCKYGSLNVVNDPSGVKCCAQYGSSYFQLKGVRLRTTFAARDSAGLEGKDLATVDYYAHILHKYTDEELKTTLKVATAGTLADGVESSGVIKTYKEAQIHGEVRLCGHVDAIMVHPSVCNAPGGLEMMQALNRRSGAPCMAIETAGAERSSSSRPHRSSSKPEVRWRLRGQDLAKEGEPTEEILVVKGASGPHASRANGMYSTAADGASSSEGLSRSGDQVYWKVGDPEKCVRLVSFQECRAWAVVGGSAEGSTCFLIADLPEAPRRRGVPTEDNPSKVKHWLAWTGAAWKRSSDVAVQTGMAASGSTRRLLNALALPHGWDYATDAGSGRRYYYNRDTGQVTWVHPSVSPPSPRGASGSAPSSSSAACATPAPATPAGLSQLEVATAKDAATPALTPAATAAPAARSPRASPRAQSSPAERDRSDQREPLRDSAVSPTDALPEVHAEGACSQPVDRHGPLPAGAAFRVQKAKKSAAGKAALPLEEVELAGASSRRASSAPAGKKRRRRRSRAPRSARTGSLDDSMSGSTGSGSSASSHRSNSHEAAPSRWREVAPASPDTQSRYQEILDAISRQVESPEAAGSLGDLAWVLASEAGEPRTPPSQHAKPAAADGSGGSFVWPAPAERGSPERLAGGGLLSAPLPDRRKAATLDIPLPPAGSPRWSTGPAACMPGGLLSACSLPAYHPSPRGDGLSEAFAAAASAQGYAQNPEMPITPPWGVLAATASVELARSPAWEAAPHWGGSHIRRADAHGTVPTGDASPLFSEV